MARDNRINMPSGIGGLVRYFDEYKSKIEFMPGHIIIFVIAVMLVILALHVWGASLLRP